MGAHRQTLARLASCGVLVASLAGCLAQKAELTQVERDLSSKISSLDRQEKELEQSIKQAKADLDRMVGETRAKFLQQVTSLREEELATVRGDLEKKGNQLARLEGRADDLNARLQDLNAGLREMNDRAVKREAANDKRFAAIEKGQEDQAGAMKADRERFLADVAAERERRSKDMAAVAANLEKLGTTVTMLAKNIETRLEQHDKALVTAEARENILAQQLEAQGRGLSEQMGQFRTALGEFRAALAGLGEKLVQEQQRRAELEASASRQTETLAQRLEASEKTASGYLGEVNKSITSVAKALQTVSETVVARLDEQQQRLSNIETQLANRREPLETPAPQAEESPAPQSSPSDATEPKPVAPIPGGPESRSDATPGTAAVAEAADESGRRLIKAEYDRGMRKFQKGDFDGALENFTEFLARYPKADLAPNAQYWLGECYYGKKDYERAIEAFDGVARAYPASEKVPAALLKKGFAYLALKDRMRASTVLKQVVEVYPKTPEAHKAVAKLAELNKGR